MTPNFESHNLKIIVFYTRSPKSLSNFIYRVADSYTKWGPESVAGVLRLSGFADIADVVISKNISGRQYVCLDKPNFCTAPFSVDDPLRIEGLMGLKMMMMCL